MDCTKLSDISASLLLSQIGEALSTPMAIKDLEHRFIYVNQAFQNASGCSTKDVIGKNDLEAGRPTLWVLGDPATGWPGFWRLDDQAISGSCPSISIDTNSGRNFVTETLRTPLYNDDGKVVALLVQLHDMSELRELKRRVASNLDAISLRDGEITTMDSVLATLMACQDTNTLLAQLVDLLVERTRADAAMVATLQNAGDHMEIVAATGSRAGELLGTTFKPNFGIMGRTWHAGEPVFIEDIDITHSLYPYPAGTQAFSLPLYVDDLAVATLMVISDPDTPDLSKEIPLLERIGGMASIAIANTHLIDATKRSLRGTHALAEVSRILPTLQDAATSCDVVCRMMLTAMDATRASSYLLDCNGQLVLQRSWGTIHGTINRATGMVQSLTKESIAQWTVQHDKSAIISRLAKDSRESTAVHAARAAMNIGSTCCLPLKNKGKVIGALMISRSRSNRDFSDAEIDLFKAVVNQLSTSVERLDLSNELQYQAFHDKLTSLPNRHSFERELQSRIEHRDAETKPFSVLFIDLDGFKEVNDSYGHATGDQLLALVAKRLKSVLNNEHVLARMGGDEFAVILCSDADDLHVSDQLLKRLNHEFIIGGEHLKIGASIGVSRYPNDGRYAEMLLQSADEAMYQAKKIGKGCIFTFNETLAVEYRERLKLEQQLREAIDRQEFYLEYQPQVRCSDNTVVGVEALIRWEHPIRGAMSPAEFIPIAESSKMINEIGAWVIEESVMQLAEWQMTSLREMRVCVNIAAPQFLLDNFCDQVLHALARHSVPPELLELEVTESVVMHDVPGVVTRLKKLRDAGIRIAIDDFGTGYSSLSYLQDLPLDVLKIDQTFVNRLCGEQNQTTLVKTILMLAKGLGLETVAEGVELPEQRDEIMQLGCNIIQGYLYSRPVTVDKLSMAIEKIQFSGNDIIKIAGQAS